MELIMPAHVTGAALDRKDSRKQSPRTMDVCLDPLAALQKGVRLTALYIPHSPPSLSLRVNWVKVPGQVTTYVCAFGEGASKARNSGKNSKVTVGGKVGKVPAVIRP